jgi:uncharacterized repeat protein (TIGR03943 family)
MIDKYAALSNHGPAEVGKSSGWKSRLPALVQTAIMVGLGVYFGNLVLSDNLRNYSNQPAWLVLSAAVIFLALGLASGSRLLPNYSKSPSQSEHVIRDEDSHLHEHSHDSHDSHGHERRRFGWVVPIVLTVPLLLGSLVPSEPLGAAAMGGNPASVPSTFHRSGPPIVDPQAWNIKEWQLAMEHNVHPQSWFDGQKAELIGFVVRPPDVPAGDFLAARFVMFHCAADAQGVGMLVMWKDGSTIPEDTWVLVKGIIHVDQINGGPVMRLHADSVDTTIGEPEAPYLAPSLRNGNPNW